MMKWLVVLSFVAGAALSWGVYVPVVLPPWISR